DLETELHQCLGLAVAEAFDVHGAARSEMAHRLLALRRTGHAAAAAPRCGAFLADQFRSADRAVRGHRPWHCTGGTVRLDHAHDLRDHVPGAAHDHGVALA